MKKIIILLIFVFSFLLLFFLHNRVVNFREKDFCRVCKIQTNLSKALKELKIPSPPKKSILICNFSGKNVEKWLPFSFSRMLATQITFAPTSILFHPSERYFFEVLTDDNKDCIYSPKKEEGFKYAKRTGVRYFLIGNIEKNNNEIKINSVLVDTISGKEERISVKGNLNEVPFLGSKISLEILKKMRINITENMKSYINRPFASSWEEFETIGKTYISDDLNKDIKILEKVIENNPYSLYAYIKIISKLISAEKNKEAVKFSEKAIKKFPHHSQIRILYGISLFNENKDKGIKEIKKVISDDPDCILPYIKLCIFLTNLHKFEEAINYGKIGVEINPAYPEIRLVLGEAYLIYGLEAREGKYPYLISPEKKEIFANSMREAKKQFEYTVAINPNYYRGYIRLIETYPENGLIGLAEESFERACKVRPDTPVPYFVLSQFYKYGYANNPRKGYSILKEAIKKFPDNPRTYFTYIDFLYWEILMKKHGHPLQIDTKWIIKEIKRVRKEGYQVLERMIEKNPEDIWNYTYYSQRILKDLEFEKKTNMGVIEIPVEAKKMVEISLKGIEVSKYSSGRIYMDNGF